ncbi:MAG: DUF2905 domain-containing protein [Candidatus Omnitrophica bacterium]|nr:DUF2905 domain-containing protein [Candidatus Omnitrophota bacterium]
MSADLQPLGRALILFGIILAVFGLLLLAGPKIPWLGRLPGDLIIQRERFSFYLPLASSLLASLILSLVLWLIGRFRH